MRLLLILFALLFAALPFDAQIWLIGLARQLLLADEPRLVLLWLVVLGTGPVWYVAGWRGLAGRLRREELERAEESYRKRLR